MTTPLISALPPDLCPREGFEIWYRTVRLYPDGARLLSERHSILACGPGSWNQLGEKAQRTVLLRASKWNVACNPDSFCYSSPTLSLQSGKGSILCSSDFGANLLFCAKEHGERSLEKGNVCAWGGGESQAITGVILCPSFC